MTLFRFKINDLDRIIRNPRDRDKEVDFLRQKFGDWKLLPDSQLILDETIVRQIVCQEGTSEDESAHLLVTWADRLGAVLKATGLSSSQIRNFFGEVRSIEQHGFDDASYRRRFILLTPKLEYAKSRAKNYGMDSLAAVLTSAIGSVASNGANFKRFVEFFEAILAYHKAYGGN